MSLIVEDGTALSTAESYASVAEADAYWALRDPKEAEAWAGLDTGPKEAYLRLATEAMVARYRMKWKGVRMNVSQALDWPRAGVWHEDNFESLAGVFAFPPYTVASNVVPNEVKVACFKYAMKLSQGEEIISDLERATISESVGPISVTYDVGSPQQKRFVEIDSILAPYFKSQSSAMMKVVRA